MSQKKKESEINDVHPNYQQILDVLGAWESLDDQFLLKDWVLVRHKCQQNTTMWWRKATNMVLFEHLEQIKSELGKKNFYDLLYDRFIQGKKQQAISEELSISPATFSRWQREGVNLLAKMMWDNELHARRELLSGFPNNVNLVGMKRVQEQLIEAVKETRNFLFLVHGLGGIGKTTLINHVTHQLVLQGMFQKIIWVEMVQEGDAPLVRGVDQLRLAVGEKVNGGQQGRAISAEQFRLWAQHHPVLLVIDNLEDPGDAYEIWQEVNKWANPATIILTSRSKPSYALPQTFLVGVDELDENDSLTLIRQTAREGNFQAFLQADDEMLLPIFRYTGGHPLAIKLVVGMAEQEQSLPKILADLPQGQTFQVKEMYEQIYRKTWQALSADARRLMRTIPYIGNNGVTPQLLQETTALSDTAFSSALAQLLSRSLFLPKGTPFQPRYGIHRLSEQFLGTIMALDPEPKE